MDSRRQQLKQLNKSAWARAAEHEESEVSGYDSSFKKNSAFVKKIRTSLNGAQAENIIKDIDTLTLSKYLGEICISVYEALTQVSKPEDVVAAIDVISRLHQRFPTEFTPSLLVQVLTGILETKPEEDLKDTLTRQRNLIRLLLELTMVGIARNITDIPKTSLPEEVIKLFGTKERVTDPLILTVFDVVLSNDLKAADFLESLKRIMKRYYLLLPQNLPEPLYVQLDNLLQQYVKRQIANSRKSNTRLNKTIKDMNHTSFKYGRVFDEEYKEAKERRDFLCTHTEALCEVMGIEFPKMVVAQNRTEMFTGQQKIEFMNGLDDDELSIWESKDEEIFYTVIPALDELDLDHYSMLKAHFKSMTDGERVGQFLLWLAECDEDTVESLVAIFNDFNLNNKATRHRLFNFYCEADSSRTFPYIVKFLKINYENLAELIEDVVDTLDKKVHSQLYHSSLSFKYLYLYIEFIKFKLVPRVKIFHKLNKLTNSIEHSNNLDILTVIYEKCGKILLHDSDFEGPMKSTLNLLKKQQKSPMLSMRTKMAISNVLNIFDPPKKDVSELNQGTKLTVEQQFVMRLVKNDLTMETVPTIATILSGINLNHPDYRGLIVDVFTNYNHVNVNNIDAMMELLQTVSSKAGNEWIRSRIVDELVENVIRGIELNDYRMNKERMAHVKLVTGLLNKSMADDNFLVDLSLLILYTGHPNNAIIPLNYDNEIDPPTSSFKISMICTLYTRLQTVPNKPAALKQKLEDFLVLFQYYIFCKEPVSKEVEFQLSDFFSKFEGFSYKRMQTLSECVSELKSIMARRANEVKAAEANAQTAVTEEALQEAETTSVSPKEVSLGAPETVSEGEQTGSVEEQAHNVPVSLAEPEVIEQESNGATHRSRSSDSSAHALKSNGDKRDLEFSEGRTSQPVEVQYFTDKQIFKNNGGGLPSAKTDLETKFEKDLEKQFGLLRMESLSGKSGPTRKRDAKISIPRTGSGKFNILMKRGKTVDTKEISLEDQELVEKGLKKQQEKKLLNRQILSLVSNMQD